jgi:hypothetical protein
MRKLEPFIKKGCEDTASLFLSPAFVDLPNLMQHLDDNFRYWKGLDEKKLRSLRPPPE